MYDLFLVLFGIVLGVIASNPLKKIFTGSYKEEARQKKRVQLLVSIRKDKSNLRTTRELNEEVFNGKKKDEEVEKLLQEIEGFGLIREIRSGNEAKWKEVNKK